MYCTHCGKKINENSNFCTQCGQKIEKKTSNYNIDASLDRNKKEKNLEVISLPLNELTVDTLKYILDSDETPKKLTLY